MRFARVGVVVASTALALTLTACTSDNGPTGSSPTQTAWQEQSTPGATAGSASAAFDPNASADGNHAAFDAAVHRVLAGNANADGATVAAALKKAGFPMSATQVTASRTSANLQPGSIMVGVKIGTDCLVGQWGTAVDGYQSTVTPALGTGGCLIGGIPVVG